MAKSTFFHSKKSELKIQSNLGNLNVDYPKLLDYSKMTDGPDFFSIIYRNRTTNFSNFDFPKNSFFWEEIHRSLLLLDYPSRFKVKVAKCHSW